jgi:hypothetical protein
VTIERSDDDAPTEVDLDLGGSATGEITISLPAKGARPDAQPADSEPTTLAPQMAVRGLGAPSPVADHPADHEGPTTSVESRLLHAYADEVQRAHDRTDARPGVRRRAPTLPTIITPSEPFRATSPTAKTVAAALPAPIEDLEEEETITAALADGPPLALLETVDDVTKLTDAPRMLSSSELITDPGVSDRGVTDPEITAPQVPVSKPTEEDDDEAGKGGTIKIVLRQAPLPGPATEAAIEAPASPPVETPAAMATSRRRRDQKGRARRAMALAVAIALGTLGLVVLFGTYVPRSVIAREDAGIAPAPVESFAAPLPPEDPVPPVSFELPSLPSLSPPSATAAAPALAPAPPRPPRLPPRPVAKPPLPLPLPPPPPSAKGWAPLHI